MEKSVKRKLLIDTDAGCDDAHAILLALQNPEVEVVGITCVVGNADAGQVGKNVLRILQVVDKLHVPVYVGCNEPLLGDKKPPSEYHGSDGFGDAPDPHAPDSSILQSEHAVLAMIRLAKTYQGELDLVCIGPLTNVAMAIRMEPRFGQWLRRGYIMGGNHHGKGNMTVSAEFNFYCDPEAAYVVLNQLGCPIILVTWETCSDHALPWDWFTRFHASKTQVGKFLASIERNTVETFYSRRPIAERKYEVVDQYAMAAALHEDVVTQTQAVYATVEIHGPLTSGQLVVDWKNILGRKHNVSIVTGLNTSVMIRYMEKMIQGTG